jgi:cell cycle sensor histidine kinase DivJ
VITLGVEALRGTIEDQRTDAHWLMQSVTRNSRYLGDLVQHFLEYSKLRSGHYELNPTDTSVATVIDQVLAQHAMQASTRGVILRAEVEPLPNAVLDELALTRILNNLVGNALRYGEAGSAVVISAGLEDGWLRVEVGDSGPGIAPEQRAQIGQPFMNAKRTHGGAGLGLFIVRSLVDAHGGSLTTVSEAGKGTRFIVRLPLSSTAAEMAARADERSPMLAS